MTGTPPHPQHTWLGSDRPLARAVGRPMMRFLGIEAAGGVLLIVATMVALFWANSPWSASYHDLWHTEIHMGIGDLVALEHNGHPLTLGQFVNDVLMVIFFFVMGLEIKRELVTGELRRFRAALLPALAALGGMVVPALIYLAFAGDGEASAGWGIPMATDIAFAVGVVSLLGSRVPTPLKVFLLTLAIIDDIGAILVIALFYTSNLEPGWLFLGGVSIIGVIAMARSRIRYAPLYVALGIVLWYSVFMSGVHTTIAGVIMGLLAPAVPLLQGDHASESVGPVIAGEGDVATVKLAKFHLSETVPVTERLENLLHPVSAFLILPVFALANAGIVISGDSVGTAVSSGISIGVALGLVLGKLVGVSAFTLLAVRLGLCSLPAGATTRHVVGISAMAGIGFTVSLFISGLAFDAPVLQDEAKIGILVASAVAALLGSAILYGAKPAGAQPAGPGSNEPPVATPVDSVSVDRDL